MITIPRGKRLASATVVLLLVTATLAIILSLSQNKVTALSPGVSCGKGEVRVDLSMPSDPSKVKLQIFNSTKTLGLASQVSADFKSRKFTVQKIGNSKPVYKGIAKIKYGPKQVGTAWYLRAFFINEAQLVFDKNYKSDVIQITLGNKFKKLASNTEKNQAIAAAGRPQLPKGGCQAN